MFFFCMKYLYFLQNEDILERVLQKWIWTCSHYLNSLDFTAAQTLIGIVLIVIEGRYKLISGLNDSVSCNLHSWGIFISPLYLSHLCNNSCLTSHIGNAFSIPPSLIGNYSYILSLWSPPLKPIDHVHCPAEETCTSFSFVHPVSGSLLVSFILLYYPPSHEDISFSLCGNNQCRKFAIEIKCAVKISTNLYPGYATYVGNVWLM
jgi:hypothetical protein